MAVFSPSEKHQYAIIAQLAANQKVLENHRKTRKRHSAEEKIRIVLGGLRGEDSIAGLCRREGMDSPPRGAGGVKKWADRGRISCMTAL